MTDFALIDRINWSFKVLLQELSTTWPKEHIEYVDDIVGHREFEEALENLIALGLRNGQAFSANRTSRVEELAGAMGLRELPWLDRLCDTVSAQRRR